MDGAGRRRVHVYIAFAELCVDDLPLHMQRWGVLTLGLVCGIVASTGAPPIPVHEPVARIQTRPKSVTATCANLTGDCTLELQAALDTGAEIVRIPHIGRPWVLSMAGNPNDSAGMLRERATGYHGAAISLRSHQQWLVESGVVLQAARGSFHGEQDSLLMGAGVENISIVGLPPLGATLVMWKMDYANASLYPPGSCSARGACRMGISLMNCSNGAHSPPLSHPFPSYRSEKWSLRSRTPSPHRPKHRRRRRLCAWRIWRPLPAAHPRRQLSPGRLCR